MAVQHEARTFRVVGPQERVDERQTPHPMVERGVFGERLRLWRKMPSADAFARIFNAGKATDRWNALQTMFNEAPEGKVNPVATTVADPARMARNVKELARFFGAHAVGITYLDPAHVYSNRARGCAADGENPGDPVELKHKYAICMGVASDYDRYMANNSHVSDAEYMLGNCMSMVPAFMLASYIREMGYPARWHAYGKGEVRPVPLSIMAGLGELGRHGMMINEKYGSRLHLAVVTTDLPLVIDQPVDIGVNEFCQNCKKCAYACPSRSITFGDKDVYKGVEKWRINVDSCYSYRLVSHDRFQNCLFCVTSCPYNFRAGWWHDLTVWMLKRTQPRFRVLLVKPLKLLDDLLRGKRPYVRTKWLDYDSDLEGEQCELEGCTAVHQSPHKKRLQRPGREAWSRIFPSDTRRGNDAGANGHTLTAEGLLDLRSNGHQANGHRNGAAVGAERSSRAP